jgi:hypothetical protein
MTISKTLYPLSHAFSERILRHHALRGVMKHIFCVFYLFIPYSSYAHTLKIGPTDPKVFGLFQQSSWEAF